MDKYVSKYKEYISPKIIEDRVKFTANKISNDYSGRTLDLICLTGGGLFLAVDLARLIDVEVNFHIMSFASYSKSTPLGQVKILQDIDQPLEGKDVLVVEGVIVSGKTPQFLMDLLKLRNPASLEICALGIKPSALKVDMSIRYSLFEFGEEWIEGYGIGSGANKVYPGLIDLNDSK